MRFVRRLLQASLLVLLLYSVFIAGANAEAWCPFGGVEAIYTYWTDGNMLCSLGVTNFFALGGVLLLTLVARRAFCGYLCPIGAVSEWLHALGRRAGLRPGAVRPWVDRCLSAAKYVVLGLVLYLTWQAGELIFRGFDPCYALLSKHGADITFWAYAVAGGIVVASLFWSMPFCRWLCPLAAVLNPFSATALTRVKRDPAACHSCARCARSCPMAIPVDELEQVTAARCLNCLECVEACPPSARALSWGPPSWLARRWPHGLLAALVLGCTAAAVGFSYLAPLPSFVTEHGKRPVEFTTLELNIDNLTCRGRGNLLDYFLRRDDLYQLRGYLKLEAWPGPGWSRVRISYDPKATNPAAIRQAICQWYFDATGNRWLASPFVIEGYDPLAPP